MIAALARRSGCLLLVSAALLASRPAAARAPTGKPVEPSADEQEAMGRAGEKVNARIVWSTSRESGHHDIFIMNAGGSDVRPLTTSDHVDWFPRFSPDGTRVTFCRSKARWVSEMNAKRNKRWDIFSVNADGTEEKKLIPDATWATWTPDGKILFSRTTEAYVYDPATGEEVLVLDGAANLHKRVVLQQPQMSPDGKHIAITLRGRMRETGIWDLANESWTKVGGGCQINWFPSGDRIIRVNENTGRGKTEVWAIDVADGKPVDPNPRTSFVRLMDLPGRRSHEYFPKISADGKWMVWCATARGHDHDIYDYEVYIWEIGTAQEEATRLTFHSGNDRWPDVFVVGEEPAREPALGEAAEGGEGASESAE